MSRRSIFKIIRLLGDILFVNISFLIAFYIRFKGDLPLQNIRVYSHLIPYITIFSLVLFYLYNLYSDHLKQNISEIIYSFFPAGFLIVLFSTSLSYFFQTYEFPRSVFLITLPLLILLMILWRVFLIVVEKHYSRTRKMVIIGTADKAEKLKNSIKSETNGSYIIEDLITRDKGDIFAREILRERLTSLNPDEVLLTSDLKEEEKKNIFYLSLQEKWDVSIVPGFYEIMISGSKMEQIGIFPIFEMESLYREKGAVLKRFTDIVISLIGLIIMSPLLLVVPFLIKMESKGPVLFTQKRVSKDGHVFKIYKFRTMVEDAEKHTGPVLATEGDNRITQVGKYLRKFRIDEFPQLFNVLKGDMSIVGPRPERPYFVKQFSDKMQEYDYRHFVKSGVTGLAQITGFYSSEAEDKLKLDLLYANHNNFVLDLKIMLQTLKVMIMGSKSR